MPVFLHVGSTNMWTCAYWPVGGGREGTSGPLWRAAAWCWWVELLAGTPGWPACRWADSSPPGCGGAWDGVPITPQMRAVEACWRGGSWPEATKTHRATRDWERGGTGGEMITNVEGAEERWWPQENNKCLWHWWRAMEKRDGRKDGRKSEICGEIKK